MDNERIKYPVSAGMSEWHIEGDVQADRGFNPPRHQRMVTLRESPIPESMGWVDVLGIKLLQIDLNRVKILSGLNIEQYEDHNSENSRVTIVGFGGEREITLSLEKPLATREYDGKTYTLRLQSIRKDANGLGLFCEILTSHD